MDRWSTTCSRDNSPIGMTTRVVSTVPDFALPDTTLQSLPQPSAPPSSPCWPLKSVGTRDRTRPGNGVVESGQFGASPAWKLNQY